MFDEIRLAIVLSYSYWASGFADDPNAGSSDQARRCYLVNEASSACQPLTADTLASLY